MNVLSATFMQKKSKLQINLCFLLAKHYIHYIWFCRHKVKSPKWIDFFCYFKHIHIIKKTKANVLKKWEPFVTFSTSLFFSFFFSFFLGCWSKYLHIQTGLKCTSHHSPFTILTTNNKADQSITTFIWISNHHLTLKTTSTRDVETSVTINSPQGSIHLDNHICNTYLIFTCSHIRDIISLFMY